MKSFTIQLSTSIVRLKFIWRYGDAHNILCYSYGRCAATSLHTNVGNKRRGCEVTYSASKIAQCGQ